MENLICSPVLAGSDSLARVEGPGCVCASLCDLSLESKGCLDRAAPGWSEAIVPIAAGVEHS